MLRVRDIAKRLALSESKVYQLIRTGELPHYKLGGALRVSEDQLMDYLVASQKGAWRRRRLLLLRPPRSRDSVTSSCRSRRLDAAGRNVCPAKRSRLGPWLICFPSSSTYQAPRDGRNPISEI